MIYEVMTRWWFQTFFIFRARQFRVLLDQPDLGAHITYSKQVRNASLVARFKGLKDFWEKLRCTNGSFSCKTRAVASAAWPRAMHGISATWVSLKHLHDLRSQYMHALRLDKPGANSYLQLHLDGFGMDPSAYSIIQSIRDFRDLGSSDWHLELLSQVIKHQPGAGHNTVTRVLQQRLEILGWQFLGQDIVQDDLGRFKLSTVNWGALCLRIQRSWHKFVHGQVAHRADYEGFQHVDVGATRQLVQQQAAFDQGVCRRHLNGSTLTNAHSCFWSTSGCHLCTFCGCPDSLFHRYWECKHSGDLRAMLTPDILQTVAMMPPACAVRSWQLQSTYTGEWWSYLLSIPDDAPEPAQPLEGLGLDVVDVFTDGSCYWQNEPRYRLAAWSIVLAQPLSLSATCWDSQMVASGPLGGLIQTSYRAELTAVAFAIRYARQANVGIRIWSDCQAVVDKTSLLLTGRGRIKANTANADLWNDIMTEVAELGPGKVTVVKVAAHEEIAESDSEFDRWCKLNNACADAAAKTANSDRSQEAWLLWEKHSGEVEGLAQVGASILQHQLAVSRRWTESRGVTALVPPKPPRVSDTPAQIFRVCAAPVSSPPELVAILGDRYTHLLMNWWHTWIDGDAPIQWISFAQCFIHFQLWARHPGLVRQGRVWVDPHCHPLVLPENHTFRTRCRWFRLQLQQMWKSLCWTISTCTTRPSSDHLPCHIGCGALPVKQECLTQVNDWLAARVVQPISGHGEALDNLPLVW